MSGAEDIAAPLRRASCELRDVIDLVEGFERTVGRALSLLAGAPELQEFQKLDQIQQKILGVADFLDALSRSTSPAWTIDAANASRRVRMAELGARLGDSARAREPAPPSGICELF